MASDKETLEEMQKAFESGGYVQLKKKGGNQFIIFTKNKYGNTFNNRATLNNITLNTGTGTSQSIWDVFFQLPENLTKYKQNYIELIKGILSIEGAFDENGNLNGSNPECINKVAVVYSNNFASESNTEPLIFEEFQSTENNAEGDDDDLPIEYQGALRPTFMASGVMLGIGIVGAVATVGIFIGLNVATFGIPLIIGAVVAGAFAIGGLIFGGVGLKQKDDELTIRKGLKAVNNDNDKKGITYNDRATLAENKEDLGKVKRSVADRVLKVKAVKVVFSNPKQPNATNTKYTKEQQAILDAAKVMGYDEKKLQSEGVSKPDCSSFEQKTY